MIIFKPIGYFLNFSLRPTIYLEIGKFLVHQLKGFELLLKISYEKNK